MGDSAGDVLSMTRLALQKNPERNDAIMLAALGEPGHSRSDFKAAGDAHNTNISGVGAGFGQSVEAI